MRGGLGPTQGVGGPRRPPPSTYAPRLQIPWQPQSERHSLSRVQLWRPDECGEVV